MNGEDPSGRGFTLAWIAHFAFSSTVDEKKLCDYSISLELSI